MGVGADVIRRWEGRCMVVDRVELKDEGVDVMGELGWGGLRCMSEGVFLLHLSEEFSFTLWSDMLISTRRKSGLKDARCCLFRLTYDLLRASECLDICSGKPKAERERIFMQDGQGR
jgi:hypothetical protein